MCKCTEQKKGTEVQFSLFVIQQFCFKYLKLLKYFTTLPSILQAGFKPHTSTISHFMVAVFVLSVAEIVSPLIPQKCTLISEMHNLTQYTRSASNT